MTEFDFQSLDNEPVVSELYNNISSDYKISNLDISYFDITTLVDGQTVKRCPNLKEVWNLLCENFDLYYATREIGGYSEYDFFCMMQSCLNRNADTLERQLNVYWDDIANPILGRTEKVTYNTLDAREQDTIGLTKYGHTVSRGESGADMVHHVDVPADSPQYDTDRTRDKTDYGRNETTRDGGKDASAVSTDDNRKMTGTVTTELSDLGVRPNYEALNGFLDNNRSFIQEFINVFEECFAPRYRRIYF